jgi:hypothetical protein
MELSVKQISNWNAPNNNNDHRDDNKQVLSLLRNVTAVTANGTKLQLFQKSGSIRILKPDNSYMQLWLDKLEETNASGQVVQSSLPFATNECAWEGPIMGSLCGVAASSFKLVALLDTDATYIATEGVVRPDILFSLVVYLFTADGTVEWAGKTWPVTKGQVKATVNIQTWPFRAPTNRLRFGIRMKSQGGRHTSNPELLHLRDGDDDAALNNYKTNVHDSKVFMMGPVVFVMPKIVQVNDLVVATTMATTSDVTMTTYKSSAVASMYGKGNDGISWSFPYFSKQLVYEPTIDSVSALAESAAIDGADMYVSPLEDATIADAIVVVQDAGFRVQVLGQSGKVRIINDDNSYFQLTLDKLEERSPDTFHLIQTSKPFAAHQLKWVGPTSTTLSGVEATLLQLSMKVTLQGAASQVAVPFVFDVYIFHTNGTITWAGQSWDVTRGQVKFTLDIQDWPFKSSSNKLCFGLRTEARGGKHTSNPDTLSLRDGDVDAALSGFARAVHHSKVSLIGPAALSLPKLVQINSLDDATVMRTSNDVTIAMYASAMNKKRLGAVGRDSIQWTFPYFSKRLVYDPTIDVKSTLATTTTLDPVDNYVPPAQFFEDAPVDADDVVTDAGHTVKVLGQSGTLRITKQDKSSIQLSMDKLEELDASGAVVQRALSLNAKQFAWQGPTSSAFNGIPVTTYYISSTLEIADQTVGVPFVVQVFVFNAGGVFTWAGNDWNVKKGQIKFTLDIQNWPFKTAGNRLCFGVCTKSTGGKHASKLLAPLRDGDTDPVLSAYKNDVKKSLVAMVGPSALLFPKVVQINDPLQSDTMVNSENVSITTYDTSTIVTAPAASGKPAESHVNDGIQWIFPYFTKSLVYDPTIDVVSSLAADSSIDADPPSNKVPENSSFTDSSTWTFTVGVLAVCVAVGAGIYLYKRSTTAIQPKRKADADVTRTAQQAKRSVV